MLFHIPKLQIPEATLVPTAFDERIQACANDSLKKFGWKGRAMVEW